MIKKLFFAFFLGVGITLYSLYDDQVVKRFVADYVQRFVQQNYNCRIECFVDSIHFFNPQLILKAVSITPEQKTDQNWHWCSDVIIARFSFMALLQYRYIQLDLIFQNLVVTSAISDSAVDIMGHIFKILYGKARYIPVYLNTVTIDHAQCTLHNEEQKTFVSLECESKSFVVDGIMQSRVNIKNSSLSFYGRPLCNNLFGVVTVEHFPLAPYLVVDCTSDIPQFVDLGRNCMIKGTFAKGSGSFSVVNQDKTLSINPITISTVHNKIIISLSALFPFSYFSQLIVNNGVSVNTTGTCYVKMIANATDLARGINGHLEIKNIQWGRGLSNSHSKIYFSRRGALWNGGFSVHFMPCVELNGSWEWNQETSVGRCDITNPLLIEIPGSSYWIIKPNDYSMTFGIDPKEGVLMNLNGAAYNHKINQKILFNGVLQEWEKKFVLRGSLGEYCYSLCYTKESPICFDTFSLHHEGVSLMTIERNKEVKNHIAVEVEFPFIRSLIKKFAQYDVQGTGRFVISADLQDNILKGNINLVDGTIRLAETYNFINQFSAQFTIDYLLKKVTIDNSICGLYKGSIFCKQAVVYADDRLIPFFAHAPFLINSCLLNIEKDFFSVISGSVVMSLLKEKNAHVCARLILDRSQVKENLFSKRFLKKIFTATNQAFKGNDIEIACDVSLKTKDEIQLKTFFIDTAARIDLLISNTVKKPQVSGAITFAGGSLLFPYKPLLIKTGTMNFVSGQLYDPLIEIIASNNVKKHQVTLRAFGSLQHPEIVLESSPALSEAHITSLLLAGSYENSLNVVLPALAMKNIKNFLFDSNELGNSISRFLSAFKNVRFIPSLSDQRGRQGLHASLEVDFNNRWHALIQKNFSSSEDTRFELGYAVTDDVNVRLFRDEVCDVGGEVEFCVKF